MLEPNAVKVARSVLKGLGVGNDLRLLDAASNTPLRPRVSVALTFSKPLLLHFFIQCRPDYCALRFRLFSNFTVSNFTVYLAEGHEMLMLKIR